MKLSCGSIGLFLWILISSCAQPPEYQSVRRTEGGAAKAGGSNNGTPAAKEESEEEAESGDQVASTKPTPSPTPTPTVSPTPTPSPTAAAPAAGVAATGRGLVMQTCAGTCHVMAGNTIDAKTSAALEAAGNLMPHQANRANFFTPPAAGGTPNNFSHVLAYLMSIPTPIMGPNIP